MKKNESIDTRYSRDPRTMASRLGTKLRGDSEKLGGMITRAEKENDKKTAKALTSIQKDIDKVVAKLDAL